MKLTADTNFLISATQWDYSVSHKLLIAIIEKNIPIFTTQEILQEFSTVLKRDFHYTIQETEKILEVVLKFVTVIETKSKINVVKDDPDDNKVLECAFDSGSDYILTYDQHLLKLKDYH